MDISNDGMSTHWMHVSELHRRVTKMQKAGRCTIPGCQSPIRQMARGRVILRVNLRADISTIWSQASSTINRILKRKMAGRCLRLHMRGTYTGAGDGVNPRASSRGNDNASDMHL